MIEKIKNCQHEWRQEYNFSGVYTVVPIGFYCVKCLKRLSYGNDNIPKQEE